MGGQYGFLALLVMLVAVPGLNGDEPECRTLDAAVRWLGDLYLFSGDEYVEIDDDGNEVDLGDISEWDDLPSDIEAAVQWTGNYQYYFFKHPDYFRYDLGNNLAGPWNAGYWWDDFFEDGIDAAGNRLDESYFFRGCVYRTWYSTRSGISGDKTLPTELPCDLHAAWDIEDDWEDLVLAKNDQIWIWREEGVEGPYDFSEYYNVTSWTLCSEA